MASNAENVFFWWRHHEKKIRICELNLVGVNLLESRSMLTARNQVLRHSESEKSVNAEQCHGDIYIPFNNLHIALHESRYKVLTRSNILWSWWRHQMEIFSALLAICAGNSPVPGEFPTQRPVTQSFDVYFDLRPNKRLSYTIVRLVILDAIAPSMTSS